MTPSRIATCSFYAVALTLAGCASDAAAPAAASAPNDGASSQVPVTGDIVPVHDPEMLRDGSTYYLFTTGHVGSPQGLLPMRTSHDLHEWKFAGPALADIPAWAKEAVPGTSGTWAPHIVKIGGQYRLYYSISTFAKNRSAIGLLTNNVLDPDAPARGWQDRGAVVTTNSDDDYNAIDPAVFTDAKGREWMAFGSFWGGLKMVELDPATGKRLAGNPQVYSIAARPRLRADATAPGAGSEPGSGAIEAPFVIAHDGRYYLFASFGFCCRGAKSTYSTVVGRSDTPTGPYIDRDGTPMMQGGGTEILSSGQGDDSRFVGRGHVSILQDADQDYIIYHAYDRQANGAPTLRIRRINWTDNGWPVAD
ncbi:arabinan endo-1,5-alpha-L-arabinosidase [Stakelama sp. CBK3Z-3]|uniref:Extracellular exo-alpha-(1->5)-L-arabinofuranosidase n=1 Tax=Stakelama flava TaxID=2860338 RepID=A0ABS6XM13_9SPHN|nr:arabinan endo-1,5-alpha-L-arabinosidase [Stakelama flava]MBW4331247.1 arabinan endo-1,5-alpha-L-arabinosidase [Stakelama flava]